MNQKTIVHKDLLAGKRVTSRDMGLRHDIWCLQERIRDLRNDGVLIEMNMVRNPKTKKSHAEYRLLK